MKININPMEQVIKRAELRINFFKAAKPQDLAHDVKRQMAADVVAGKDIPASFERAATIESMTPLQLALTIMSKTDTFMDIENYRRELIVKVRAAKTPEEVKAILSEENIPEHFSENAFKML